MKNLNPNYITGFADAESTFCVSIQKNSNFKSGWRVKASFQLHLHKKDLRLLECFQKSLGVGAITVPKTADHVTY